MCNEGIILFVYLFLLFWGHWRPTQPMPNELKPRKRILTFFSFFFIFYSSSFPFGKRKENSGERKWLVQLHLMRNLVWLNDTHQLSHWLPCNCSWQLKRGCILTLDAIWHTLWYIWHTGINVTVNQVFGVLIWCTLQKKEDLYELCEHPYCWRFTSHCKLSTIN